MVGQSVFYFVLSSSVRVDILSMLAASSENTRGLIDRLDASQSSVYTAVSDLEERRVLFEGEDGWQLTGRGRLVLDIIEQWQSTETLLQTDPEYWDTHRTDVLPAKFRRRLPELGDYEVVRSEPPTVRAHARKVVSLLESTESCDTAVPIHVPEYDEAYPNSPDSRLIFPPSVIDQYREEAEQAGRDDLRPQDRVPYRVRDMKFGFTAADEFMVIALPPYGEKMVESVLTSTEQSAIRWASELFDYIWADAEPLEAYCERQHY